jgi:hypothetical protein
MRFSSSSRPIVVAAIAGLATFGSVSAAASTLKAAKTIRATRITRQFQTLAPGSRVTTRGVVGQRTFVDGKTGFALASVGGADYPVTTTDGGTSWNTDGPALHLDAAQAPLVVGFVGVVNRRTVFAWGGGGQVIDSTSDGGKTWYRALFTDGSPIAVVHDAGGHLLAFVRSFSGSNTLQYVSRDGGHTWQALR